MGELEQLRDDIRKLREEIAALRQQLVFDSSRTQPSVWPTLHPTYYPPSAPGPYPGWPYTTCGSSVVGVCDPTIRMYNGDAGQA